MDEYGEKLCKVTKGEGRQFNTGDMKIEGYL